MQRQREAEPRIKAVRFPIDSPSGIAGQIRWVAADLTSSGRVRAWCRCYHLTERQAQECGAANRR